MSLNVIILLPNGHRKNVKVTSNTAISQTLSEVCKKNNLNPEEYSFEFRGKNLDESLSWRFANVPNNAKLELVKCEKTREETPVRIALQYEGEPRLQGSFLPSNTLSDILNHWKDELSTLTPPQGHEPSILYIRQEITGVLKLQKCTLRSLGLLSGSAILRFSFKPVTADDTSCDKTEKTHSIVKSKHVEKKLAPKWPDQSAGKSQESSERSKVKPQSSSDRIITQEMLENALLQVSGTAINIPAESSSSTVTMDTADSSFSVESIEMMTSRDRVTEKMEESKNGRARSKRPDSDEMPKKKVKHVKESRAQNETKLDEVEFEEYRAQNQPNFSNFKFPEETEGMDVYSPDHDDRDLDIAPLMKPCDRETIIFDEKEIEVQDVNTEDPGDEFFELTIDDIRRMISELRSLQSESDDKPLMTARSREKQRLRSINQYPKIIIRVSFPNRKIIQGFFRPAETVETLYEFVKGFLSAQNIDFYLYTTPPKVILKDMKSILYDHHLAPASKVYFGLKNSDFDSKMLSEKCDGFIGSAADANLKLGRVFEMKSPVEKKEPMYDFTPALSRPTPTEDAHATPSTSNGTTPHPSGARPKVPKWFKLGK